MQLFLLLALVIAAAIVILTIQNSTVISLTFIKWTLSGPLAVILAIPLAAGFLAGIFLVIPIWWKKAKTVRKYKKRVQELESELSNVKEQINSEESTDKSENHDIDI